MKPKGSNAVERAWYMSGYTDAVEELSNTARSPIPIVIHCPICHKQHLDEGDWKFIPHKMHRCVDDGSGKGCGNEWRPCARPTVGVCEEELV